MTLALDNFQVQPTTTLSDSTGNPLTLRWWYGQQYLDVDGVTVMPGGSLPNDFYLSFDCSITSSVVTVEASTGPAIFTTLDAQIATPQSIQVFARFYQGNTPKDWLFNSWVVPSEAEYPGGVITFEQLTIYNEGNQIVNPPANYWTQQQTTNYFNTLSPAPDASALVKGITKLSLAPVSAINPIAVGDNDPRLSTQFLFDITNAPYNASTSNTAAQNATAIAAAVAAASSAGAGIYVPVGTFATNSVTISVLVQFAPGGSILAPATGQTVTLAKAVDADISKHFGNALSAQGTVSFSGNARQKNLQVAWWGATGDGSTDDTAAINAASVAAGTRFGCTLNFTPGAIYNHTGITLDHLGWVTILGSDSESIIAETGTAPRLRYTGTAGGTMITMNNCYGSTLRGFYIGDDGTHRPDIGIYVTMTAGGDPVISSQDVIEHNIIAGNTRTGWIGIKIDNASGTNNEQHTIRRNLIVGGQQAALSQTGKGISMLHGNIKQVVLERNAFIGLAYGVHGSGNPTFRAYHNIFSGTGILYGGAFGDAIFIEGDDEEGGTQVWAATDMEANTPVTIIGGRYADLHGGQTASGTTSADPIFSPRSTKLTVIGNRFASVTAAFNSNFILDAGGGNCSLVWLNNTASGLSSADFITGRNTFQAYAEDVTSAGTFLTSIVGTLTDSGLTAGRVTFAGTAGLLSDDSDFTFSGDTLSATKVAAASLTSGRVPFASTAGLLIDDADLTFATDTLTATKFAGALNGSVGATTPSTVAATSVAATGLIKSSSPTAGVGYAAGSGGAVTQGTSRTTTVVLNTITGAITLFSAEGSATPASFTVTNSAVAATDTIIVNQKSGTDLYEIFVTAVGAGSFRITSFTTGGTTTEQPVFNFSVIKGVAA